MMSEQETRIIRELRQKGAGYKVIAAALGVSRDTVRGICKRYKISDGGSAVPETIQTPDPENHRCACCKKELIQNERGRAKRFCSADCRRKWWYEHPEIQRKNEAAIYSFTCGHCGKQFSAYGDNHRKYCSHACYIKARFWKETPELAMTFQ